MIEVKYQKYQCQKCGETDTVKIFDGESFPHVINCWNCHAGYQKELGVMAATGEGMFPVAEEISV
jgi:hypothetical protein